MVVTASVRSVWLRSSLVGKYEAKGNHDCYAHACIVTFNFDISKFWVDTEGKVARQHPRGGRPGNDADSGIFVQWEGHNHCKEQGMC